jgi:hypothetical protein
MVGIIRVGLDCGTLESRATFLATDSKRQREVAHSDLKFEPVDN